MPLPLASRSSTAVTLDAPPAEISDELRAQFNRVGFVEGTPQITSDTMNLLRVRLRAAAGFLFLAFGLFFAWRVVGDVAAGALDSLTFDVHFITTVALGGSFVLLCRKCCIPLKVLRVYEVVIFGLPVVYFLLQQYDVLGQMARLGFLPSPLPTWMGLVFTYAMFIPNTWRRAAVVIGTMCVLPLVLVGFLYFTNAEFVQALERNRMFVIELVIMLGVTCAASTYGTHVINTLRNEAFEAKQLGQYKLCRMIGAGGMGEVYLAEHQMMKRPVAIKIIRPSKAADPHALARFEREVRSTAKLSHWNTIEIFDYGRTEDGTFYYVMEYLPGSSLSDLVEKHGPLPAGRAIHLLMQTCDALFEAHRRGLIHRDIKPGNIFAAQRGGYYDVAKLLDFGLAKPIASNAVPVQLTQDGSITGSPMFMSPEQALGDSEPDARSDVYSLGAVAYYLLTGHPPFEGDKPIRVILAHAQQEVTPPSRLRPDIPADLEQVVLRCLAKDPADRYQTAAELRDALADCVAAGGWNYDDAFAWWMANGTAEELCAAKTLATAEA